MTNDLESIGVVDGRLEQFKSYQLWNDVGHPHDKFLYFAELARFHEVLELTTDRKDLFRVTVYVLSKLSQFEVAPLFLKQLRSGCLFKLANLSGNGRPGNMKLLRSRRDSALFGDIPKVKQMMIVCLLYTSDAADE